MTSTPLKEAFAQWRTGADIEIVASEFQQAKLFVVGKKSPPHDEAVFYLTRSKNPERLCVTVSEDATKLSRLPNISLLQMMGSTLLRRLGLLQEVIVVYDDGGDYLTAEHLEWMRQNSLNHASTHEAMLASAVLPSLR